MTNRDYGYDVIVLWGSVENIHVRKMRRHVVGETCTVCESKEDEKIMKAKTECQLYGMLPYA